MIGTTPYSLQKKRREESFLILPNITISQNELTCLVIDAPQISNDQIVTNDVNHQ
jgi:O-succinylbenzoic acid--CoA ligase